MIVAAKTTNHSTYQLGLIAVGDRVRHDDARQCIICALDLRSPLSISVSDECHVLQGLNSISMIGSPPFTVCPFIVAPTYMSAEVLISSPNFAS